MQSSGKSKTFLLFSINSNQVYTPRFNLFHIVIIPKYQIVDLPQFLSYCQTKRILPRNIFILRNSVGKDEVLKLKIRQITYLNIVQFVDYP